MKASLAFSFLGSLACAHGLLFPLQPKALFCPKNNSLIRAPSAAILGTAVAAGGVALLITSRNRNVYEPPVGSMTDKVVVITGASSGLGLESAKRLSAAGATIVLTSRDAIKGQAAVDSVQTYLNQKAVANPPKIYSLLLDLDDLESVKQFPELLRELAIGDINVLINNAGVMAIPDRQLTVDGYERTFQSNHLGHFVLTAKVFPLLSTNGAKVINVASDAYNIASQGLDLENLNGEKSYSPWIAYGHSKLANILFTQELQRRADAAEKKWFTTVSLHPGVVSTDFWRFIIGESRMSEIREKSPFRLESLAMNTVNLFTKTPSEGASTQIFLAAAPSDKLSRGSYYDNMKVKSVMSFAEDKAKAEALWEISEKLGKIKFDLTPDSSV